MKTEYTQQAEEFLAKTNTKMTINFSHTGKHFIDDKQARNVYRVVLQNKKHTFAFNFGDSVSNTEKYNNAKSLHEQLKYKPTKYDVLACLDVDYSEDFKDFCENFGYEQYNYDNEKNNFLNESAFLIFKSVQKETKNLKELFTEDELELLHEIQ